MAHITTLSESIKWAVIETIRAAHAKDYLLTRKHDREMKALAEKLSLERGYILATDKELAERYPSLVKFEPWMEESPKILWAIRFSNVPACRNKMAFTPYRIFKSI